MPPETGSAGAIVGRDSSRGRSASVPAGSPAARRISRERSGSETRGPGRTVRRCVATRTEPSETARKRTANGVPDRPQKRGEPYRRLHGHDERRSRLAPPHAPTRSEVTSPAPPSRAVHQLRPRRCGRLADPDRPLHRRERAAAETQPRGAHGLVLQPPRAYSGRLAFHTEFIVFGEVAVPIPVVPWILPTVVGIPRHCRRCTTDGSLLPRGASYGRASAIHSPGWSSEPIGSTMYCLPPCM